MALKSDKYTFGQLASLADVTVPTVEKWQARFNLEQTLVDSKGRMVKAYVLTEENIDVLSKEYKALLKADLNGDENGFEIPLNHIEKDLNGFQILFEDYKSRFEINEKELISTREELSRTREALARLEGEMKRIQDLLDSKDSIIESKNEALLAKEETINAQRGAVHILEGRNKTINVLPESKSETPKKGWWNSFFGS